MTFFMDDSLVGGFLHPISEIRNKGNFGGFYRLELKETEDLQRILLQQVHRKLTSLMKEGGIEALRVDVGLAADLLGQKKDAIRELETALENREKDVHYPLGRLLLELKQQENQAAAKPEEKISWTVIVNHLRAAIAHDSTNINVYYFLGKALQGLIKTESLKNAEEAYKLYLDAGAPIGFRAEAEEFVQSQDPERKKQAVIERGKQALERNKNQVAIDSFEEAIRLGDQESYYHLGRAYQQARNYPRAVDAYEKARSAGIEIEDIQERFGTVVYAMINKSRLLHEGIAALSQASSGRKREISHHHQEAKNMGFIREQLLALQEFQLQNIVVDLPLYLSGDRDGIRAVKEYFTNKEGIQITIVSDMKEADYQILAHANKGEKKHFAITEVGNEIPLVQASMGYDKNSLRDLETKLNKLSRWHFIKELKNLESSNLGNEPIRMTVTSSKIEYSPINGIIDLVYDDPSASVPQTTAKFQFTNMLDEDLYMAALYMDRDLSIMNNAIQERVVRLTSGDSAYFSGGRPLPVRWLDEKEIDLIDYGVSHDYFFVKIITSSEEFTVDHFQQKGEPHASSKNELKQQFSQSRSLFFVPDKYKIEVFQISQTDAWTTQLYKIRMPNPRLEKRRNAKM